MSACVRVCPRVSAVMGGSGSKKKEKKEASGVKTSTSDDGRGNQTTPQAGADTAAADSTAVGGASGADTLAECAPTPTTHGAGDSVSNVANVANSNVAGGSSSDGGQDSVSHRLPTHTPTPTHTPPMSADDVKAQTAQDTPGDTPVEAPEDTPVDTPADTLADTLADAHADSVHAHIPAPDLATDTQLQSPHVPHGLDTDVSATRQATYAPAAPAVEGEGGAHALGKNDTEVERRQRETFLKEEEGRRQEEALLADENADGIALEVGGDWCHSREASGVSKKSDKSKTGL